MAKIVVKFRSEARQEYSLDTPLTTIGRSPECAIHIDNQGVSRRHAQIVQQEGRFRVEDLNSHNGTFVGGQRIQKHVLCDGDEVLIGKHTLQFIAQGEASASAPLPSGEPDTVPNPNLAGKSRDMGASDLDGTMMMKAPFSGGGQQGGAGQAGTREVKSGSRVGQINVLPMGRQLPGFRSTFDLTAASTTIGKSASATIRLAGWFMPSLVGVITRDGEGYFVVPGGGWSKLSVNGDKLDARRPLSNGDILEIRGYKFQFQLK